MRCTECGERTEVLETKQQDQATRRRRQCLVCGVRFTTTEVPRDQYLSLVRAPSHDEEVTAAIEALERRKREIAERQREAERVRAASDEEVEAVGLRPRRYYE